ASSVTTGSNGIASVGWTLGTVAGNNNNAMTATTGSLTPVTFTATGTASTPAISSISPAGATNSGSQTIVIAGTGFSGPAVTLAKTGQSAVTGSVIGTDTATALNRNFNLNGITPGSWNLVILNPDGGTVTGTFTVSNATGATVVSISPTSGTVNTTVSTTIAGTGFVVNAAKIRIYRSGNYIAGAVTATTSTQITGTFNLNQAILGSYNVCVLPDGTEASIICSPTFTINSLSSAVNGSIYLQSSPSGASVYLSNTLAGTTTFTLYNVTPGGYQVLMEKSGYHPYTGTVTVTAGNQTTVYGNLAVLATATTATAIPAPTTYTPVPTVKRTLKPTPTPWPSATPTPASPVGPLAIIGAVGIAILVMRK